MMKMPPNVITPVAARSRSLTRAIRFDAAASSLGSPAGEFIIFTLYDGGSIQCDLRYNFSTSTLRVTRNGTQIASAVVAYGLFQYRHLEWTLTTHNSAGVVEVRLDGDPLISASGLDTQNTGNAFVNALLIGFPGGNDFGSMWYDCITVLDDVDSGVAGAPNDSPLGDVRVDFRKPNGNGNSSDLVGSDGNSTDNYLLEDESAPNDDADYVQSSTVGDEDTYAYENLASASGSVFAVQLLPWAKKTDAGARAIAAVSRLGTSEEDGPDLSLTTNYRYFRDIREADPDGDQWTIANFNAAEFGVKVTA